MPSSLLGDLWRCGEIGIPMPELVHPSKPRVARPRDAEELAVWPTTALGRSVSSALDCVHLRAARSGVPSVVLLHGAAGPRAAALSVGDAVLPLLGEVLLPDLSGPLPVQPGVLWVDLLAARVVGAMDAAGIMKAVLVGHGLGAVVAARVAARRPERVRAILNVLPNGPEGVARALEFLRPPAARWRRALLSLLFAVMGLSTEPRWWRWMLGVVEGVCAGGHFPAGPLEPAGKPDGIRRRCSVPVVRLAQELMEVEGQRTRESGVNLTTVGMGTPPRRIQGHRRPVRLEPGVFSSLLAQP